MTAPARVLIVDDEPANIEILNAALEEDCEICFATSGEEAIRLALETLPDLILLDVMMPGIDGYEVCRRLKQEPLAAAVPIIFTTALGDPEAEVRGLTLGAIDYLTKPISPMLVRARVRNHVAAKRMRDQLAGLAVTDPLTGLKNRRWLEEFLKRDVGRAARAESWLAMIMLDIDFFKAFNDTYGHVAGDRCITAVAGALNRSVRRAADMTVRYGGEEFACLLPDTDHEGAMKVGRNICDEVRALAIPHSGSTVAATVTVSVGVAAARCKPGMAPGLWIEAADRQLYRAKDSGRNRVAGTVFDGN
jgi:diguanylate cyclase (GGDEF)-like protein